MDKNKAYHQIALACLKVLRDGHTDGTEQQIKTLYQSIDQAFEQQYHLLVAELTDCKRRLHAISELEDGQPVDIARKIATITPSAH